VAKKKKRKSRGTSALEKTPSGRSAGPKGKRSNYPGVNFTPPKSVQNAAKRGLKLRKEAAKRKSRPGGTEIGVARARQLSRGTAVDPRSVRRMKSFFARHRHNKGKKGWGSSSDPSPAYVAWLLWGGDPGDKWAKRTWDKMQKVKKNPEPPELEENMVETLTVVEGMNGVPNPGELVGWMENHGMSPLYVGLGAVAGLLLHRENRVGGAVKGAILVGAALAVAHYISQRD